MSSYLPPKSSEEFYSDLTRFINNLRVASSLPPKPEFVFYQRPITLTKIPMNPYEYPARDAYERFRNRQHKSGWKDILLPTWDELPKSEQESWMAAIAPLVDENNSFQERIRQSMKTITNGI